MKIDLKNISKEELSSLYKNHSLTFVAKYYGISIYNIKKLLKAHDIKIHESGEAISMGAKNSRELKVSKEDLTEYYSKHSIVQTGKHFNISKSSVEKLLEEYDIQKHNRNEAIKLGVNDKYGVDNVMQVDEMVQRYKDSMMNRYGVASTFEIEDVQQKIKESLKERHGVEHSSQIPESRVKAVATSTKHFGKDNYCNRKKAKETNIEKYGVSSALANSNILSKMRNTCLEKYGVAYNCMRKEARLRGNNSKPNQQFEDLIKMFDIKYEREFVIDSYSYDFKVGNTLIEINPSITHNSTFSPFGNKVMDKDYHFKKSKTASIYGYRCIHIWDWDNKEIILKLLTNRIKLYARKCVVKEVSTIEAKEYLNKYHLQGYCKSKINIGLFYNDELVSLMTFGKPRYNKNYHYELLRYCSHCNVIGGGEKLFKYFMDTYKPTSIISYCDKSKFNGNIYLKLGFIEKKNVKPSKHWYNLKTNVHITDNLLRQRGFDQLFNTSYGNGTSNEELMRENGFVEIYDCGQSTYILNCQ